MQKFVVLTLGRAGSNLLCGMLNQHRDIICHYEVFNNNAIYLASKKIIDIDEIEKRNQAPEKFITNLMADVSDCRAAGFKLMFVRDAKFIEARISDSSFKKIVLMRANFLAQFSSLKIAQLSGEWSSQDPKLRKQIRFHFNRIEFLRFIDLISETTSSLEAQLAQQPAQQIIRLDYVDLLKDRTLPTLYEFLDVPVYQTTHPTIVKQNTNEILDRFDNPESAERCLRDLDRLTWSVE